MTGTARARRDRRRPTSPRRSTAAAATTRSARAAATTASAAARATTSSAAARAKDRVRGDSGNDLLLGGAGNDDLRGGSAATTASAAATGADRVDGGAGNDLLDEPQARRLRPRPPPRRQRQRPRPHGRLRPPTTVDCGPGDRQRHPRPRRPRAPLRTGRRASTREVQPHEVLTAYGPPTTSLSLRSSVASSTAGKRNKPGRIAANASCSSPALTRPRSSMARTSSRSVSNPRSSFASACRRKSRCRTWSQPPPTHVWTAVLPPGELRKEVQLQTRARCSCRATA